jgi:hypothetical protein
MRDFLKSVTLPKRHAAIYARKSSEEGLEQAFNSLDAQREACAAFIVSQNALRGGQRCICHNKRPMAAGSRFGYLTQS